MKRMLRHTGPGYSGIEAVSTDGEYRFVQAMPGQIIEVSEAKAQQLLADFPGEWEDLGPVSEEQEAVKVVDVMGPSPNDKMVRSIPRKRRRRT